jgi:ABC-type protease/lipase transport system fused ATPase/permease subunit
MGHVNLVGMYIKHASHILLVRYCDPVHKLYESWPILTKLNESWPNVTQLLRTQEEPKIENSHSERCDII